MLLRVELGFPSVTSRFAVGKMWLLCPVGKQSSFSCRVFFFLAARLVVRLRDGLCL